MEKDVLIIKRETPLNSSSWRPITVSVEAYQNVKALAEETNLPISKVAGMLINFATERVVIEK